jgi:hypothetical protein
MLLVFGLDGKAELPKLGAAPAPAAAGQRLDSRSALRTDPDSEQLSGTLIF